jgi:hypothetical protein
MVSFSIHKADKVNVMPLISCPICTKDVSASAPACPNCGHPIAQKSSQTAVRASGLLGAAEAVVVVLIIVIGIVAVVTKPSESSLRTALTEKYGLIWGVGVVAEKIGLVNISYHDYIFVSRLSVQIGTDPERTVAYGFFGKTIVPDVPVSFGSNQRSSSRPAEPTDNRTVQIQPAVTENLPANRPLSAPIPAPAATPRITEQPAFSEGQMRQGLQNARQTLISDEMREKASDTFSGRHPFSRIEQCNEPDIQSFNTSLYGEEIVGVYTCRMRGAISGKNTFVVTVRVGGAIAFQDGSFVRKVVGSDVTADYQEN